MAKYNADEFFGRKPFTMCRDCVYPEKRANGLYCAKSNDHIAGIGGCRDGKEKPPTNADSIRAMTDEELAEWHEQACPGRQGINLSCEKESCVLCWLDWLKAEVE